MGGLTALDSRLEAVFSGAGARISVEAPLELRGPFLRDGGGPGYYLRNVTAGIFAGDAYRIAATATAGARVRISSSSAAKVHAMPGGIASSVASLVAETGSSIVWGPHATILQADSNLTQSLNVTVGPGGRLLLAEVLVLGRLARGESCAFSRYQSDLVVSDGNRPLYEERYVLKPGATLDTALGGHGVIVSVYGLGQLDEESPAKLRALVAGNRCAGVSRLPNDAGLVLRALATSMSSGLALAEAALGDLGG